MSLIRSIVLGVVKWALVIGIAGGLTDLTLSMKDEAVKAHKAGLVNLKQLNKVLVGP